MGGAGTTAGVGVGGGINATNGTLTLIDSIVANNYGGGDFYYTFSAITDGGYNISSDFSFPFTAPGSLNNTDPKLGSSGNYGGPTPTLPLLAGSPAIDAAGGVCPPTDQRGVPRPFGGACDIGAFEFDPGATNLFYAIQGQIQGLQSAGGIRVSTGLYSTQTDGNGNYTLAGLMSGTYTVTPSFANGVFVPFRTPGP